MRAAVCPSYLRVTFKLLIGIEHSQSFDGGFRLTAMACVLYIIRCLLLFIIYNTHTDDDFCVRE